MLRIAVPVLCSMMSFIPLFSADWRSRYLASSNVIEINSGHRDYIASRERIATLKRYIAKLYAKEIVLMNLVQSYRYSVILSSFENCKSANQRRPPSSENGSKVICQSS